MEAKPISDGGLGLFGRLINLLSEVAGYLALAGVIMSMLIITYEVLARYLFTWPTVWEIEAAIFLLILTTFVGSAYTLKYDGHISMDIIVERLKPVARARLEVGTAIGALIFCALVSVRGWEMWWEAFSEGWVSDSLWAPPLWIPYLFLPLGFSFLSLQYVVVVFDKIHKARAGGGS